MKEYKIISEFPRSNEAASSISLYRITLTSPAKSRGSLPVLMWAQKTSGKKLIFNLCRIFSGEETRDV